MTTKKTAKKTIIKKPVVKKPATKKAAAKKVSAKKTVTKKPVTKKAIMKKAITKKSAAQKTSNKKASTSKPAKKQLPASKSKAQQASSKKAASKKPTTKRQARAKRLWQVLIENQHKSFKPKMACLEELCQNVLKNFKVPAEYPLVSEVSLLFINDEAMRKLNKVYRNKDKPTDVLSFSMLEGEGGELSRSLGDIVISIDTAKKQAKAHKQSLAEEISYLLIHGLLHLLGYDHEFASKEEAKMMFAIQDQLFASYGSTEVC